MCRHARSKACVRSMLTQAPPSHCPVGAPRFLAYIDRSCEAQASRTSLQWWKIRLSACCDDRFGRYPYWGWVARCRCTNGSNLLRRTPAMLFPHGSNSAIGRRSLGLRQLLPCFGRKFNHADAHSVGMCCSPCRAHALHMVVCMCAESGVSASLHRTCGANWGGQPCQASRHV